MPAPPPPLADSIRLSLGLFISSFSLALFSCSGEPSPITAESVPPMGCCLCDQEADYFADLLVAGVSASPMAWTFEDRKSLNPDRLERNGPYSASVYQDALARRAIGYDYSLTPIDGRDTELAREAMVDAFMVFESARDDAAVALYDCLLAAEER